MRGRLAAAVCAAALLVLPASAHAENAGTCDGDSVSSHRSRAKELISHGFSHHRWRDSTPARAAERRLWTSHVRCLNHKKHRRPVNLYRIRKRESFYRYRKAQRAALAGSQYTPYDCGSAGRWAIPCSIVACESGYSWSAYNASGAAGPYQLMAEHGRPWPVDSTEDRVAHHRIAANLYNGGAGRSNWVC